MRTILVLLCLAVSPGEAAFLAAARPVNSAMPLSALPSIRAGLMNIEGDRRTVALQLVQALGGADAAPLRAAIAALPAEENIQTLGDLNAYIGRAPKSEREALERLRDQAELVSPLYADGKGRLSQRLKLQIQQARELADALILLSWSAETTRNDAVIIDAAKKSADLIVRRRHYLNDPGHALMGELLKADAVLQREADMRRPRLRQWEASVDQVKKPSDLWRLSPNPAPPNAGPRISPQRQIGIHDEFMLDTRRFEVTDHRGNRHEDTDAAFSDLLGPEHPLRRLLEGSGLRFPDRLLEQRLVERPWPQEGLRVFESNPLSENGRDFLIRLTIFELRRPVVAALEYLEENAVRWSLRLTAVKRPWTKDKKETFLRREVKLRVISHNRAEKELPIVGGLLLKPSIPRDPLLRLSEFRTIPFFSVRTPDGRTVELGPDLKDVFRLMQEESFDDEQIVLATPIRDSGPFARLRIFYREQPLTVHLEIHDGRPEPTIIVLQEEKQ